jgi:hypothetical protein
MDIIELSGKKTHASTIVHEYHELLSDEAPAARVTILHRASCSFTWQFGEPWGTYNLVS